MIIGATVGVLGALWVIAAAANDGAFWAGASPAPTGIVATLAVFGGWLVFGTVWGRRSPSRFALGAAVFWAAVALGGACAVWLLGQPLTVSQGAGLAMWLARVALIPLYGLAGVITRFGEPFKTMVFASIGLALAVAGYYAGRRRAAVAESSESR